MRFLFVFSLLAAAACDLGAAESNQPKAGSQPPAAATPPTPAAVAQPSAGPQPAVPTGPLRLGEPIGAPTVTLTEIAKNPKGFENKVVTTSGTVTAVCQHMGCWMELADDSGAAHIKMAGHAFFVPKTASGHKARIKGTILKSEGDDACKDGCKKDAVQALGRPLAKLEIEATGVELD